MAFEPTEELFDNLMKGLPNLEDSNCEDSDSDHNSQEFSAELEKDQKNLNEHSDLCEEPNTSSKKVKENIRMENVSICPASYTNEADEPINENTDARNDIPTKESDEISNSSIETLDEDVTDPLPVSLYRCATTEDFESVETITVDANQRTQDEDDVESLNETIPISDDDSSLVNSNKHISKDQFFKKENNELIIILSKSSEEENFVDNDAKTERNLVESSNSAQNCKITGKSVENQDRTMNDRQKTFEYLKSLRIFSNLTSEMTDSSQDALEKIMPQLSDFEGKKLNCVRYNCRGCDKIFWILRFYYQHIARVTTTILYNCKVCKKKMKFTNACLLKIHLMSHGQSANNVIMGENNLKVEMPSLNKFKHNYFLEFSPAATEKALGGFQSSEVCDASSKADCPECHIQVPSLVEHLMYLSDNSEIYKCSACPFIFTSKCAHAIHERIHTYQEPYCCPECGVSFVTQNRLLVHLSIECYHFRRFLLVKCSKCDAVLSDEKILRNHVILHHCSVVYKCSVCSRLFKFVSALKSHISDKHTNCQQDENVDIFIKCGMCLPKGKIFTHNEYNQHISEHTDESACTFFGFKCRKCKFLTQNPYQFQKHMESRTVCRINEDIAFKKSQPNIRIPLKKRKCEEYNNTDLQKKMCNIYSSYRPYNLNPLDRQFPKQIVCDRDNKDTSAEEIKNNVKMTCLLCSKKFYDSVAIKNHIVNYHKCNEHHKYVQIALDSKESSKKKMDSRISETNVKNHVKPINTYSRRHKKNPLKCPRCIYVACSKEDFRAHVIEHREDSAYQCLECGECFVCKSPLEIHLVSVHAIKDTVGYISTHFVHNSLPNPCEKPKKVKPNQCSVCLDLFPDEKALQLHFRSHGMAFLRQNFTKRVSS